MQHFVGCELGRDLSKFLAGERRDDAEIGVDGTKFEPLSELDDVGCTLDRGNVEASFGADLADLSFYA